MSHVVFSHQVSRSATIIPLATAEFLQVLWLQVLATSTKVLDIITTVSVTGWTYDANAYQLILHTCVISW